MPRVNAVRTTCPYCGVGCGLKAVASAEHVAKRDERAAETRGACHERAAFEIAGDPEHPANLGRVCSKGAALADTLGLEGRLLYPEIGGRRVAWQRALGEVAGRLHEVVARFGPDAVAFYVSGQLLTEDYYVANKLIKGFIGSANIDTNSRLCMASAVAGYQRAFGTDTVPCSYADVEEAELVVLVGSNAAWCHPVLFRRIASAKAARPDLKLVVVDPRRTATAEAADLFLPLAPASDAVLFNGLLDYLRREDALDWRFLEAHTEGFAAAFEAAKGAGSVPAVARACGLADGDVATFFRWFAAARRTVTLFSQGVNQSSSGTDKVNAIINVHLATGRIGKPGTGPFSLTGQPNAMGGREVGGLANQLAAHMDFAPANVDRLRRFWTAPAVASGPGLKAVELFEAVESGRIKALWIMCTNPAVTMPDADRVRRALERCDFVVVSDTVRETDTTATAHVLLPAAAWGEKSGTVTNSERRISRQRAFLPPAGEARPDWWIVTQVARRMGFVAAFPYESAAEIFGEHARLSAFENAGTRAFDIGALAALTPEGYEALGPVQWPLPAPATCDPSGPARVFGAGHFLTPSGKARLVAVQPRPPAQARDAAHPLVLNTGRIRDQWHTMTRTGTAGRLSGHRPEPFVEVHPDDAERFGVVHGGLAEVSAGAGRLLRRLVLRVEVTTAVRPGQLFVPMHWSGPFASRARVCALIPANTDPVSGQPELKHAAARLGPYRPAWQSFLLSRDRLALDPCTYSACARGRGHWRYEAAGDAPPPSWPQWSRARIAGPGDWIEYSDPAAGRYRAALIRNEQLQACVFVTSAGDLPGRAWLATLFEEPCLEPGTRSRLLSGSPGSGAGDPGPVVCACFSLARGALVDAIRTRKLVTVEQIGRALQAGTRCGSCTSELAEILAAERA